MKAIDEFVRLQAAASEGPWQVNSGSYREREFDYYVESNAVAIWDDKGSCESRDAEFIAHARNSDIGRLAQDLAARLERIRDMLEPYETSSVVSQPIIKRILALTDTAKPLGER